jgi:hypothetical protein
MLAPAVVLLAACLIAYGAALLTAEVTVLQTWTMSSAITLEVYVNGTLYQEGQYFDWGNITLGGVYTVDMTVWNMGPVVCQIWIEPVGLPMGWTQSWSSDYSTVPVGGSASGDLILDVATDVPSGTAAFVVHAEET